MLICICGKSGSGKTTLTNMICKIRNNVVKIDIDKIGHKVLEIEHVKKELQKCFGLNILNEFGRIDRKILGSITFDSKEKMKILEKITWNEMEKIIDEQIDLEIMNGNDIILDWILLKKTKYFDLADERILIEIPIEIRKNRILERDKLTEELFELREKAAYRYNESDFDIVIKENVDEEEKIRKLVKKIWNN